MRIHAVPLCFLACFLVACSGQAPVPPATPAADPPPRVGGDRDAHGCIPSAGYAWCAATKQCERPWELAKAKGFESSQEGFDAYCGKGTQ